MTPARDPKQIFVTILYWFPNLFKKSGNRLNRGCRGCQEACGFNLRWVINSKVDFLKNRFFTQIRTAVCRLPGRGLFFLRNNTSLAFWDMGWHGGFILTPNSDDGVQASWQGPFFSRNHTYLDFQTYLCDFRIFWKSKRRGNSPEEGSTNFQPVMFDMDTFGDKKVPCTKYTKYQWYLF